MKQKNETWTPKWVALPILDFVRKIRSFGDDSGAGFKWIRAFADDLLLYNENTQDEFTRELLMDARQKYARRSAAGKLGGRPPIKTAQQPGKPDLPTASQVYDFAAEKGLDDADARDWFEMTVVDRCGHDKAGRPIANWKGALTKFCYARKLTREDDFI